MKLIRQLLIVCAVSVGGLLLSLASPFPLPATVASMILLFLLLLCKIIRPNQIEEGCSLLSKSMAWLIVPLGAGVAQTIALWGPVWWKLLILCVAATVVTFGVTQGVARLTLFLMRKGEVSYHEAAR